MTTDENDFSEMIPQRIVISEQDFDAFLEMLDRPVTDKPLLQSLMRGLEDSAEGRTVDLGSFVQYVDTDPDID